MINPVTSRIATLGNAKVVPFFTFRTENGYKLRFLPALQDFPTESVHTDTVRINRIIEQQVQAYPVQYLWTHRCFKKGNLMIPTLYNLLAPNRLTEIVDIGANLVDGDPPYKPMLASGLCKVTGFEPQEVALLQLNSRKSPNEHYLPYAIGDGGKHTLKICQASGMTSLLTPNTTMLDLFEPFTEFGKIISEVPLKTKRLDDISEIRHIDFLKIDIQGGELSVFQHGNAKLNQCVAIQTEVSFMPLYEGQPTIGDIDSEMRSMGFVPHHLAELKRWAIKEDVRYKPNQLLEADIVFVRNYSKPDNLSEEQLKHLALIAHYCYHSCDLALFCISILEERGKLEPGTRQQYKDFVNES